MKKTHKTLALSRETVRCLSNAQLRQIAAGALPVSDETQRTCPTLTFCAGCATSACLDTWQSECH